MDVVGNAIRHHPPLAVVLSAVLDLNGGTVEDRRCQPRNQVARSHTNPRLKGNPGVIDHAHSDPCGQGDRGAGDDSDGCRLRIPLKLNTDSGDRERRFRRR